MIKRTVFLLAGFLISVPVLFYVITYTYSQPITLSDKKVIYDLPYAGILPDSPLYMFKNIRDTIIEFVTRDTIKKAELLLISSDKKISMAVQMSKSGKAKLIIDTLESAEKQALRIPALIRTSKEQGVSPHEGFIYRLKLSNVKHREVIEEYMKELPQGQEQDINKSLELNTEVKRELESL